MVCEWRASPSAAASAAAEPCKSSSQLRTAYEVKGTDGAYGEWIA
jgi:hypothetical protein